jgi:hypothetical protein
MTLDVRKLIVVALAGGLFLLGNLWNVVQWLDDRGLIRAAQHIRREYLTGAAVVIIVALLVLLRSGPSRGNSGRP